MKIVKKNKTYFLNFDNDAEAKDLENYINKDLEIKVINSQTLVLSLKEKNALIVGQSKVVSKPPLVLTKDEIKKKLIDILQDKDLTFKEKVEGQFETLLKLEDLLVFKEMLKNKEIVTYKKSDKYKKAIYVVNEEKKPSTLPNIAKEVISSQKTVAEDPDTIKKDFLKKKYAIIKTLGVADKFAKEFYPKFKNNEIKGQKSFDGYFYVIDVTLYNNTRKQILSCDLDKNFSIDDLSKKLGKDQDLLKIAIDFLKEEGAIIEKRKNSYCLV